MQQQLQAAEKKEGTEQAPGAQGPGDLLQAKGEGVRVPTRPEGRKGPSRRNGPVRKKIKETAVA